MEDGEGGMGEEGEEGEGEDGIWVTSQEERKIVFSIFDFHS